LPGGRHDAARSRFRARRYSASRYAAWDHGIVADSGALRARRSRAHKVGDYSLCRHAATPAPAGETASIGRAQSLMALAARLESAHRKDPGNARLAAELRATLLALPSAEAPDDDDPLAELRALAESVP
jgi:hypothetical protein